jgi:hypothetical protein
MTEVAPLSISGWQTVVVTVLVVLVALIHGELRAREARRRPPLQRRRAPAAPLRRAARSDAEDKDTTVIERY